MAKLDLKMQFADQCFLVSNPGVVTKALGMQQPPRPDLESFLYTNSSVGPEKLSEINSPYDSKYVFDTYFKGARPGTFFSMYKTFPGNGPSPTLSYKLPIGGSPQLNYDQTGILGLSGQLGTVNLANAWVQYSGKDTATAHVVEAEIKLTFLSFPAIFRRFKLLPISSQSQASGHRWVSFADLIRIPPRNASEAQSQLVKTGAQHLPQPLQTNSGDHLTPGQIAGQYTDAGYMPSEEFTTVQEGIVQADQMTEAQRQTVVRENVRFQRWQEQNRIDQLTFGQDPCKTGDADNANKTVPNPWFYQVVLEYGYRLDESGAPIAANPAARQALTSRAIVNLIYHEIKMTGRQDAPWELTLKYVGQTETSLNSFETNVLYDINHETTLEKLKDMQTIMGNTRTALEKVAAEGGNPLQIAQEGINQITTIVPSIPGINQGRGGWSSAYDTSTRSAVRSVLGPFLESAGDWSQLESQMTLAINQYLQISRTKRYASLFEKLLQNHNIFRASVPPRFFGLPAGFFASTGGMESEDLDAFEKSVAVRSTRAAMAPGSGNSSAGQTNIPTISGVGTANSPGPDSFNRGLKLGIEPSVAKEILESVTRIRPNTLDMHRQWSLFVRMKNALEQIQTVQQSWHENAGVDMENVNFMSLINPTPGENSDAFTSGKVTGQQTTAGKRQVYFTTIGRVIEAALQVARGKYENSSEALKPENLSIIMGPLRTGNRYQIQEGGATTENNTAPVEALNNIGHWPISIKLLENFWIQNVVARGRENYPLEEFIRDLISSIMNTALGKECNSINGLRKTNVAIRNVSSAVQLTPDGHPDRGLVQHNSALDCIEIGSGGLNTLIQANSGGASSLASRSRNCLIITATNFSLNYLKWDALINRQSGKLESRIPMFHPTIHAKGAPINRGKMQKLTFKRSEAKFVREARMTGANHFSNNYLRDVYDADIGTWGIPSLRPGNIVFVNPVTTSGGGANDPLLTYTSFNSILGIGGFYTVIKVRHLIKKGSLDFEFDQELTAIWNTFGGCNPNDLTSEAINRVESTVQSLGVHGRHVQAEAEEAAEKASQRTVEIKRTGFGQVRIEDASGRVQYIHTGPKQ